MRVGTGQGQSTRGSLSSRAGAGRHNNKVVIARQIKAVRVSVDHFNVSQTYRQILVSLSFLNLHNNQDDGLQLARSVHFQAMRRNKAG